MATTFDTDFGRIYFSTPHEVKAPVTIEELARTLKHYSALGVKVTVRNSGHSVNGQTLTDGVQIAVGGINHTSFNREKLEVTTGCGATWDSVLRAISFPDYCIPVFPNNPNQQIHIGGSASVGGIGPYAAKHGGFWNHVVSLRLVTMTGEILECSRDKNPDYFKYALAGFGRIGIIAELTIKVTPSENHCIVVVLGYRSFKSYFEDLKYAYQSNRFSGVVGVTQLSHNWWKYLVKRAFFLNAILLTVDVAPHENKKTVVKQMLKNFHENETAFGSEDKSSQSHINLALFPHLIPKRNIVYFYPKDHTNPEGYSHPWSDYIVPENNYSQFILESKKIIKHFGIDPYLLQESVFHNFLHIDMFESYVIRKIAPDGTFPLALDLPGESYALMSGVNLLVPKTKIKASLAMIDELTALCYELKGKRYLYGVHNLSSKQVEQQFGKETIVKWNKIKDTLDPKHLLNNGVIEHLD